MRVISIRNAKHAKIGLIDLCKHIGREDVVMAEIGSYAGDSAEIFASYFKLVYCIDPWMNGYDSTDAASYQFPMEQVEKQFDLALANYRNVKKIKMKSEHAVKIFKDGDLDFVYIDALHTYEGVKRDIELWLPKIKKDGWIGGHDHQGKFAGVIKAVDEIKADYFFKDTSWLKRL